jgi:hypothetical protein
MKEFLAKIGEVMSDTFDHELDAFESYEAYEGFSFPQEVENWENLIDEDRENPW